ncbi:NLI interacting factor-like phosphatase [Orpheovirus IHUMI-LCC2]|uniref:NLI interacting factor-like phosphatase n=1 Tax=Orpheovirus IHUMI-LCC2 TaxID=2023057 RepID=A0A2I2L3T7_9VIRU|nr:NLI interacting factor-like phosphatase [Orpheovirus IHUMI-LCC2]SNW62180.1 NLI interacting factor-like phosphatase [Orpheovirus IHUMI-LCC2]
MKNRHIILDIDGTLLHTLYTTEPGPSTQLPNFQNRVFKVYKRPYLDDFMNFCFDNFDTVSIWTAASDTYANYISQNIKPYGCNFTFINSYEDCTITCGESFGEFSCDTFIRKKLVKIWRKNKYKKMGFNKDNTLIIEDTPSNCICNYGNAIYVPEYNIFKNPKDDVLYKLQDYLNCIMYEPNFRDIDKRNWL